MEMNHRLVGIFRGENVGFREGKNYMEPYMDPILGYGPWLISPGYSPENQHVEPKNHPIEKKNHLLPNLHDFGFKIFIFEGVVSDG